MTTFDANSQKLNKKEFQIALGLRIKELREKKNISQTELGNLCDIERTNMNRIELKLVIPILQVILYIE